jgi:hypothetical protein
MSSDASLPLWLRLAPAAIILWMVISWPIGLALDPDRLKRPGESAYLVADLAILLPLAVAAAVALRRRSPVSRGLLATMLGALAYDATHFAVRTAQELPTTGARLAVTTGLALLLAAIVLGLRLALGAPRPTIRS